MSEDFEVCPVGTLQRLAAVEAERDALLEALRDMVSDHASLSAATLDFARAAIAKAEGGGNG